MKSSFMLLPSELWNLNNVSLNNQLFESSIYHGGFCVILSILIPHYMYLTNMNIKNTIELFDTFKTDNLLSLINDYSLFYYLFITV